MLKVYSVVLTHRFCGGYLNYFVVVAQRFCIPCSRIFSRFPVDSVIVSSPFWSCFPSSQSAFLTNSAVVALNNIKNICYQFNNISLLSVAYNHFQWDFSIANIPPQKCQSYPITGYYCLHFHSSVNSIIGILAYTRDPGVYHRTVCTIIEANRYRWRFCSNHQHRLIKALNNVSLGNNERWTRSITEGDTEWPSFISWVFWSW